ncbi:permease [Parvibaculum sp.]|uniref:permease n=1 Tax=Parvibaculum sp. TaxID=2024848 RepID=UPI00273032E7|nr:permease [Parvibaculum sp.]MDP1628486.1 permease [Parvibaculum sp.]MDP2151818.1 permease [Parvibaculum sp.]MDP3326941.1 permease [Parvibaculum sp.]
MTVLVRRMADAAIGFDRVVIAFLAVLALVALAAPSQLAPSLGFTAQSLLKIAPFLAFSVLLAGFAKASGMDNLIARVFTGATPQMILVAALFGALSPFCSCGVIPIIAALLAMGVSLPAVMAFWLASPIMDPSMFVLTSGILGPEFALYKTFAAVAIGLLGGFLAWGVQAAGGFTDVLRDSVSNGGCGGGVVRDPKPVAWRFWQEPARLETFRTASLDIALFLAKWLALAFLLESLLVAWLPAETVIRFVGTDGILSVGAAVLVGVPAYLNGYAALPLVSGFIDQGMAPGAGMAFLLAGGVTSVPAAMAVFALVRLPVFALYIGTALAGAFLLGLGFMAVG